MDASARMVPVALSHQSRPAVSEYEGPQSSFSDRVAKLLDRIDYRRADSIEQREAIFRLRYQAYLRDGTLSPNSAKSFSDHYADTDNAYLFGLYFSRDLPISIP